MRTREPLPQGAEVTEHGVRYRYWAPDKGRVEVDVTSASGETHTVRLAPDDDGYFHAVDHAGRAGDLYKIRLGGDMSFPDPFSRWQPEGVHGKSMVVNPDIYEWRDAEWKRPHFRDLVIYELHTGTFTPPGTFPGAIAKLPYLAELGINAIEIMPVADFPGNRNWGYDGVSLFAPARCYGRPDDLRALVNAAHMLEIAVILDVVYNHLGPDGNYLAAYSPYYFTKKHKTPWGDALNFDDAESGPVREMFLANVNYWMDEYHMDGFRLDATHALQDDSEEHILRAIADSVHERGGYAFAEDERNLATLTMRKPKGYGLNAAYADDFCHTVQVALGDNRFGEDFTGAPDELVEELQHGWYYRGRVSKRHGGPRGTDCDHLAPEHFLFCISNHDQSGNHAFGERLSHFATPEAYRAASALLLLSPYTPQLFMGQEWGASTPFLYFTDHKEELGRQVREGRRKEFARYTDFGDAKKGGKIPDPQAAATFEKSKLRWKEIAEPRHEGLLALHKECLRLRASTPAFRPADRETWRVGDLGMTALHYRDDTDWLLLVDLKGGHHGSLAEEEFCRLRMGKQWSFVLSTNEERFGGDGHKSFETESQVAVFKQPELLLLKST